MGDEEHKQLYLRVRQNNKSRSNGAESSVPLGAQSTRQGQGWIERGYRCISVDGRKLADHRYIVEQREGRKLTSGEVVHHVDGDKFNNAASNLVVVTRAEHRRLHSETKWKRWTPEEKARARQLHASGISTQDVSLTMGKGFSGTIRHVCNRRK